MNQEQVRVHAGRFIDHLHRLEDDDPAALDALTGLFADDAHLSNPNIERAGRDQIAAFWRNYRASFGSVRSEFSRITVADGCAGLFWRSAGTGAQGQPVAYDGVTLLEFDGSGKIVRFHGYFDSQQVRVGARAP